MNMHHHNLTPLIFKGIERAAVLHRTQKRKGVDTPFVVHPFAVGFLLSSYTDEEDTVVAGFLHDVLEDVEGYSYDMMCKEFSQNIADIVQGVTHSTEDNWQVRTQAYLTQLEAGRQESVMVSCADKIHNILSSLEGVERDGDKFWDLFSAEKEEYLWFYKEVLRIAEARLTNPLVGELASVIQMFEKRCFNN